MVKVIRRFVNNIVITGEDNEWSTNGEENATVIAGGDGPTAADAGVQDTTTTMAAAAAMMTTTATTIKCGADVKTEYHQPSTPPPPPPSHPVRQSTTPQEPNEPPAVVDPPVKKLRLNPNFAMDPARRSPGDEPPTNALSTSSSSSTSSVSLPAAAVQQPSTEPAAHNVQLTVTGPRAIQIFICNPCGIRFSSLSTLDAHQTYYCSRRHKKDSESDDVKMPIVVESDEMGLGNDTDSRPSSVEPTAKSIRTGKQYKCPHCSYSADKKVSLNRHMRMHSISPVSTVQSPPCPSDGSVSDPSVVDRYCQNCDIRFSNLRTYQAHKTHYCNTRHVVKPTQSVSPMSNHNNNNNHHHHHHLNNNQSLTNATQPPTYLALPTNPVIVVPYALVQNASVLSAVADAGPSPPTDTACIVLSDGTLQPIAQALVPNRFNVIVNNNNNNNNNNDDDENDNVQRDDSRSPPERYFSPPKKSETTIRDPQQDIPTTGKRPIAMVVQPSSPLDLRLKRVAVRTSRDEEEKENRRSDGNVTDAEDIVCAPSIPCMILSPSTSPALLLPPSTSAGGHGNKIVHQQQHQQRHPVNGVVVLKDNVTDETARNGADGGGVGKFSVSSLLHASNLHRLQERVLLKRESPPAVVESGGGGVLVHHQHHHQHHRYNPPHKPMRYHAPAALQPPPSLPPPPRSSTSSQQQQQQQQPPPPPPPVHQQQQQRNNVNHLLGSAAAAVLPYFTSEMTLRLAAAATANPATTDGLAHQFFLKQGPSKCESCNIVFCKYENFLAHKKHYCASRPPQPPAASSLHNDTENADNYKTSPEGSPGSVKPPLTVISPQSSKDSVSPTPPPQPPVVQLKPPIIQFICSTCGVKFSSFDNLTTHQAFYCPNRLTPAHGQELLTTAPVTDKSLSKCPKCKMTVEGGYHHCQAANCWKCPVCGTICPSASAAQKHLDNHNGIRAFVCTICQYKGNTLRGLRTHIRMHFNKRLIPDLMEEDYVSCVIDENSVVPTVDVGRTAAAATGKPDAEESSPPLPATIGTVATDDQPKDLVMVKQEPSGAAGTASLSSDAAEEPETSPADDYPPEHSAANRGDVLATAKYCKACDISFNYLTTFIAHKKYYCRNSAEYKQTAENTNTATVTS